MNTKDTSKKLLFSVTKKDLRIDHFRAGGKGGQAQNKKSTGVRITHVESGAVGEARDSRSQDQNRQAAFRRMVESTKFKLWHKMKTAELLGIEKKIEQIVAEQVQEKNLLVEGKDEEGNWVTLS